jgi:hydrogenase maturation protease
MIAVIGCGNPNRSDDGVGSEVVRALSSREAFREKRIRLLDAGTDGMGVMCAARGCRHVIIVDACRSGSPAGAIFEIPGNELKLKRHASLTLHDFRWEHALYAGRQMFGDDFAQDVTVLLVEADTIAFGIGLSPPVAQAASKVVSRVEHLVTSELQRDLVARDDAE